jgi:hypothetical protein
MRRVLIVEVARKTKKAAQPATEKKLRRLIRQIPKSSSGGLSCFGFFIACGDGDLGGDSGTLESGLLPLFGADGCFAASPDGSDCNEELSGGDPTFGAF